MGFKTEAEESVLDTMSLDEYLIENKEATFMMRASGDSLRADGILRGDLLVVDRSKQSRPGDIVIAVEDGSFRLRRLDPRSARTLVIEAVVTAVIRKFI